MVTKIKLPEHNPIEVFESVLGERKAYKDFYNRIKDDWRGALTLYMKNKGNPSHVLPLNLINYTENEEEAIARKKSLIGLYTPEEHKQPFLILSQMRRNHGLICCPSCGEAGVPDTLDHYLPKDEFPEFSILVVNLIPMCTACQGAKGTKYLTEHGAKKYIHPYYDNLEGILYKIIFHPPYETPTFSLAINSDLENNAMQLILSHIDGIDLYKRFGRFFPTKYLHILKLAARSRLNSTLRTTIEVMLSIEEDKSLNSWEAIFYRSILYDDGLMKFLQYGALPSNL